MLSTSHGLGISARATFSVSQERLGQLSSILVCELGVMNYVLNTIHGWGISARAHVYTALLYLRNGLTDCVQIWYVGWRLYQGGTNSFENRDQTVLLTKLSQVKIFSGRELLQLAHTIMHVAPLGRRIHDTSPPFGRDGCHGHGPKRLPLRVTLGENDLTRSGA